MTGEGKMTYENQDVYEGTFLNGKACGQGTKTLSNGEKWIGTF